MNCRDWEERIALYAGGDLPAAQVAEAERHLADCPGCQLLAGGLRQGLGALREAHEEPLEEAHFAAVRARVLAELERERRPVWRRAWVYGLAAALVLAAMWAGRPKNRVGPRRIEDRLVAAVEPPPLPFQPVLRPIPAVRAHGTHRQPPPAPAGFDAAPAQPQAQEATGTLMVKLASDDPTVAIYWIAETRGE